MSEVGSTFVLKIGEKAPGFCLPDGAGREFDLEEVKGERGTLVAFVCNHCPYVVHVAEPLARLMAEYAERGITTVAINSNDVEHYPQDSPERMLEFAQVHGWEFPYLYDESQQVARAYAAACTPDFFLLDGDGRLFYAGQFDDSRPGNSLPVDGRDLRVAMDAMLAGEEPPVNPRPATGCNIKWKRGNEPSYYGSL